LEAEGFVENKKAQAALLKLKTSAEKVQILRQRMGSPEQFETPKFNAD